MTVAGGGSGALPDAGTQTAGQIGGVADCLAVGLPCRADGGRDFGMVGFPILVSLNSEKAACISTVGRGRLLSSAHKGAL